jgi:hypothetical protein
VWERRKKRVAAMGVDEIFQIGKGRHFYLYKNPRVRVPNGLCWASPKHEIGLH